MRLPGKISWLPACCAVFLLIPLAQAAHAQESAPKCRYIKAATLPISFESRRPTIEGSVNGKPVTLLVDSGAFSTALHRPAAERLGLKIEGTSEWVSGVNSQTGVSAAWIDELSIGPLRGQKYNIRVIGNLSHTDGVVGSDFLLQQDLEISLLDNYLKFYVPDHCDDAFVGYWDGHISAVDFRPFSKHNPMPVVKVEINGQKVLAMIDTGAPVSLLSLKAAKRIGIDMDSPEVKETGDVGGIGTGRSKAWKVPIASFVIGDEEIKNAHMLVTQMKPEDIDDGVPRYMKPRPEEMLLGADFIRAHRMLFAVSQKQLYFSYLGGNAFSTGALDDLAWLDMAAQKGNVAAQSDLCSLYAFGDADLKADLEKAVPLCTRAADAGNKKAQVRLATLYRSGLGVRKDIDKAVSWYRKAADQNYLPAWLNLAAMFHNGEGIPKNDEQAFFWYAKAAEQGDQRAQLQAGLMHLQGKGTPRDADKARELFGKATRNKKILGHMQAGRALYDAGEFAESVDQFKRKIAEEPDNSDDAALWLFLARARSGDAQKAQAELKAASDPWPKERMSSTIAAFLLGNIDSGRLFELAKHPDAAKSRGRLCQANFYTAQWHVLHNDLEDARRHIDAALKDCPNNIIEYEGAVAEQKRLRVQ